MIDLVAEVILMIILSTITCLGVLGALVVARKLLETLFAKNRRRK